jgi:MoxR-like ATPase
MDKEVNLEDLQGYTGKQAEEARADLEAVEEIARSKDEILSEVGKVIVGQERVVELLLIALFSRGHGLFVGVPGLAKTLLVSTLASVLNLEFNRIQFTPDLMPSDITGTEILQEDQATGKRAFTFIPGPVFANIILADEINRTSPKTQAALLQSMQEYKVTAGGKTHQMDLPFMVFATQNPIEQEGTYPLPEAQLDRFMFEITVDYPSMDEELQIVRSTTSAYEPEVKRILSAKRIIELQDMVRRVPAAEHVIRYAISLVRKSRPLEQGSPEFIKDWIAWGAGPRASQFLILGGKARAILNGRYAVTCEDVKALAHPVLKHRLIVNFRAEAEGVDSTKIIEKLLETVPEQGA